MGRYTCSDCAYMDTNIKSNGKYRCENYRKSGYDEVSATMIACSSFCDSLYSRRSTSERQRLYNASRDKGLWIMTAIMNILDLEEKDLYLREFAYLKHVMLPLLNGGNEWVSEYDTYGPAIAVSLEKEEDKKNMAQDLFRDYIMPFHILFEQGKIDDAFSIYQLMFRTLKIKYGLEPKPKKQEVMRDKPVPYFA